MMHLKYSDKNQYGTILVHYPNNVFMGDMIIGDDGYYAWWPNEDLRAGYIPSWVLRELADKLDELNKDWDEQLKNDPTIS